MPSQWPITGGQLMARHCVLAGWRPYDSRAIKRRQYFVSENGSSIYIKPYFHCCYRCCYMYIMDVNKDVSSDFLIFSALLDLQSIRDDEATTSKYVLITSRKTQVEVANSGKTITFYFPKISENSRFRSFKLPIIRKDSCGPWHLE